MAAFIPRLSNPEQGDIGGNESAIITAFMIFVFVSYNIELGSNLVPISVMIVFIPYAILFKRQLFFFIANNKTIVLYPLVVLISALWSDIPMVSFSGGMQLCITIGAGILMGVCATQRQLIRGLFVAMAIVAGVSILWGRTGPSAVGPVLIGVTGSKNMMGNVGLALFSAGLAIIFDRSQRSAYRYSAFLLAPLGAYIATNVQSASILVEIGAFVLAFLAFFSLRYLNRTGRWSVLVLLAVLAIPSSLVIYNLLPDRPGEQVLLALNKDTTLTGRTWIWEKAEESIANSPVTGHGFRSFWLGDSSDAIGILHKFKITDPHSFEIHETFLEILVDTGWAGLIPFLITAALFLIYVIANVFLEPNANSAFIATTYLVIISRTPTESIILPNVMSAVLFYATGTASIVFFLNKRASMARNQRVRAETAFISPM